MKTTNISKKKYNELEFLELDNSVIGTEGKIYKLDHLRKQKLFKNLYNTSGSYFANKLYTLEMLDNYKELFPSSFVVPTELISVAGKVTGFSVPYIKGITLKTVLNNTKISNEEKLLYLKKIGVVLDKMKDIRKHTDLKDFYIGDLHENNFLIDPITKKIFVIDVDSIKIADNSAFPAKYLTKYSLYSKENKNNFITNEKSDLYCYNTCILNFLYKDFTHNFTIEEYYEYLNYLESLKINKELMKSFDTAFQQGVNINPYQYLESLTDTQIGRASSKVFKLVR